MLKEELKKRTIKKEEELRRNNSIKRKIMNDSIKIKLNDILVKKRCLSQLTKIESFVVFLMISSIQQN